MTLSLCPNCHGPRDGHSLETCVQRCARPMLRWQRRRERRERLARIRRMTLKRIITTLKENEHGA